MYVRLHNATVLDCRWKRNSIRPGAGGCEFLSYFVSFVFYALCCWFCVAVSLQHAKRLLSKLKVLSKYLGNRFVACACVWFFVALCTVGNALSFVREGGEGKRIRTVNKLYFKNVFNCKSVGAFILLKIVVYFVCLLATY